MPVFPIVVLLVAASTCLAPACAAAAGFPEEVFEIMDDQRLVVFMRHEDLASNPAWEPGRSAPPLSVGEAIERVLRWAARDRRLDDAEIRKIELKPVRGHEREHAWYYLVQLRTAEAGRHTIDYAAVLLNGKVLPVIAAPEAIK